MDFPIKLHRRKSWSPGEVWTNFVIITSIENGRVIGVHDYEVSELRDRKFNVKLNSTEDGKGMFNTGTGSAKARWYLADIGKVPKF
jgi:hypothetical protein